MNGFFERDFSHRTISVAPTLTGLDRGQQTFHPSSLILGPLDRPSARIWGSTDLVGDSILTVLP